MNSNFFFGILFLSDINNTVSVFEMPFIESKTNMPTWHYSLHQKGSDLSSHLAIDTIFFSELLMYFILKRTFSSYFFQEM